MKAFINKIIIVDKSPYEIYMNKFKTKIFTYIKLNLNISLK